LNIDWSSLERWRKIHRFPKHSEKEKIIQIFGLEVWNNIVARKKQRYSVSNKKKAEIMYKNKRYEEIHGEEKALEIKQKISAANRNSKRSVQFKKNLSIAQQGWKNSNWKGGFYSLHVYNEIDRIYVKQYVLDTWNRYIVIERNYTCEHCGKQTITCNGHHILSFTKIFEAICFYLNQANQLNTMSVIKEMHNFHKQNYEKIYKCLCPSCHQNIHKQDSYAIRIQEENQLLYLLKPYFPNPEPSLEFGEGAERSSTPT
jgi:hypothetical protein